MPTDATAAAARRRWPKAAWITGHGRFASVAYCDVTTVALFATRAVAEEAKAFIDRLGCGHACHQDHAIVELATEGDRGVD